MDLIHQLQARIASTLPLPRVPSTATLATASAKLTHLLARYTYLASGSAPNQPFLKSLPVIGLLAAAIFYYCHRRLPPSSHKLPPSPRGAWPLLGHLPLLARHASAPNQLFAHLAATLGPVFLLRLGAQRMLVVNSDTLARESLLRRGKAYAGRMLTAPWAMLTEDGADLGFAPYGDTWRGMRRAAHKILTPAAVEAMDTTLECEADRLVEYLANHPKVQVPTLFQRYTANVIFSKAVGITFETLDDPKLTNLLDLVLEAFRVMAVGGGIDEYVPDSGWFWGSKIVRWVVMRTAKAKMDILRRVLAEFHQGMLMDRLNELKIKLETESREERKARELCYAEELLIQAMEGNNSNSVVGTDSEGGPTALSTKQIKLMMVDLLIAGMDTTAGTLIWLTILLVNHPRVQTKAYEAIVSHCGLDSSTGKVRVPTLADATNLAYIRAIVKEVLRLVPVAPLGIPRATTEDTQIAGFHVSKGTQVVYNIEAIHADMYPETKGGNEFRPERWLEGGAGSKGAEIPDGIYTFGLGRRQCPGMHLAHRELCLVTARMVAAFEMKSGDPKKKMLSMERRFGLTTMPKEGALVEFVPRMRK